MSIRKWKVILLSVGILFAHTSVLSAAEAATDTELQALRNQFYAEEKALTEEWNSKASQPGVDQAQLKREIEAKHAALRKHYSKNDPRGPYLDRIDSKLGQLDNGGMQTESTGGSAKKKPKHIGADVDVKLTNKDGSPATPERINEGLAVVAQDAKDNNLRVNENAARVDVTDQEVTGWRAASPEGRAVTQNDPDANVTPGGLEATRNPGEIKDEKGAFKDIESKYETARANCDLKTMGKCVAKAADNQGSTRARVIDGEDGKTFDLQEGVDAKGNPTYEIPRDPKPGNNEALVDKARALQNYETTNEAGVTTPGAGEQVNRMEVESAMNDMDQEMAQLGDKASKKGELRQAVRENFAESYDEAATTGSGEAGQRTRLNPETGEFETGHGGDQIRDEIDRVNQANAAVDDNKINPGKQVPTGTDPYTGGNRPTGEAPNPLFSDPELQSALGEAEAGAARSTDSTANTLSDPDVSPSKNTSTSASSGLETASPLATTVDGADVTPSAGASSTASPDVETPKPPSSLLDGGKSTFAPADARTSLNNAPTKIDDAAEAAMEAITGEGMDRSPVDPDSKSNAGTVLGAGMTAANAYGAAMDLKDGAAAQDKADKAGEEYDSALESNQFDDALRANQEQFTQQTKADGLNSKGQTGAASTAGGLMELADNALDTPANGLGAAGSSVGVALDGFQAGNSIGKAEQARRSMERAQQHAATLRSRGLEEQAQRYDRIAAENYETLLSEGEAANGGAIKTGVGIMAAGGSTVAGVGAAAYGITRAGIERTAPGKALEEGKADLGARFMEWWNGAPELDAEEENRAARVARLREGLENGDYTVTEGIDPNDIEAILANAERSGDFTHITAILDREKPPVSQVGAQEVDREGIENDSPLHEEPRTAEPIARTAEPEKPDVNPRMRDLSDSAEAETIREVPRTAEEDAELDELLDALEADIDASLAADTIREVPPRSETHPDHRPASYSDEEVFAALGRDANDAIYEGYQRPQRSDSGAAYATLQERSNAMNAERARQGADVGEQGRAAAQAMAEADREHASSMADLSTDLRERAAARDAIAGAVSSGLNSGVYGAGRQVGSALGREALGDDGGCGGCGGGGGGHSHDENGRDAPNNGGSASGGGTGMAGGGSSGGGASGNTNTGNDAGGSGGGSSPACDRADSLIDELFALQRKFLNGNGKVSVQPRHDQVVNLIDDQLNACSKTSPSRSMQLAQRLQNSPLAQAGSTSGG